MIQEARAGNTVVRLKGGDPCMFGRGGEELAALRAAGIEVEVVNGISAGVAAPATLDIPLTQRNMCGVAFITGHTRETGAIPWHQLVASQMTLVVYMGIASLQNMVDELLANGMAPTMPIAVIQDATLPSQRSLVTCLRDVYAQVVLHGIGSPSIVVIGEVAGCARVDYNAPFMRASG
jgi:uroporphyrin-III C-methyltransferase